MLSKNTGVGEEMSHLFNDEEPSLRNEVSANIGKSSKVYQTFLGTPISPGQMEWNGQK